MFDEITLRKLSAAATILAATPWDEITPQQEFQIVAALDLNYYGKQKRGGTFEMSQADKAAPPPTAEQVRLFHLMLTCHPDDFHAVAALARSTLTPEQRALAS